MSITRKGWVWIFVIFAASVVAVLLYFYFSNKNKANAPKSKNKTPINKPTTPPPSGTSNWTPESFPLNVGMYGPYIKQLQAALGINQDGKFGTGETKPAVLAKGYNIPLSQNDYNTIAIIGQTVFADADNIPIQNYDFTFNSAQVRQGDQLGKIVDISGTSYIIDPSTSNPKISASGNIYVQQSDVYFGDLN